MTKNAEGSSRFMGIPPTKKGLESDGFQTFFHVRGPIGSVIRRVTDYKSGAERHPAKGK